ncbi:AAA family ATPase [Sphingomonas silueang]|uniref:AAA family ATPase n=1 Tax=Sphingomonas silueang TaxID=3156617 RepID=UPI0032B5D133
MTHSPTVTAAQEWLMRHKVDTGASWQVLAERSGIAQGTLSQFGPGSYKGDMEEVARKVARFRSTVEAQAELALDMPEAPRFVLTRTAAHIKRLLTWGHRGKLIVIAGGPGIGKTTVCRDYAANASNVWVATMSESTAGLNPMQIELLAAMGEPDAKGAPHQLSRRICEKARGAGALIILDEAQKLTEKAVEEARSWHDRTGVGLALVGNDTVLSRLEGGSRKANYAQLYSRVDMRMIRAVPSAEDVEQIAAAWGVGDEREVAYLVALGTKPGGLRSVTKVMELASMLAFDDGARDLTHIRAAWAQLSTRPVAA